MIPVAGGAVDHSRLLRSYWGQKPELDVDLCDEYVEIRDSRAVSWNWDWNIQISGCISPLPSSELGALAQVLRKLHSVALFFQEKLIPAAKARNNHPGVVDFVGLVHKIQ